MSQSDRRLALLLSFVVSGAGACGGRDAGPGSPGTGGTAGQAASGTGGSGTGTGGVGGTTAGGGGAGGTEAGGQGGTTGVAGAAGGGVAGAGAGGGGRGGAPADGGGAGGAAGGSAGAGGRTDGSGGAGGMDARDAASDAPMDARDAAPDGPSDAASDAPRGPVMPAPGATLVRIDPSARRQTFEGWGTSLCWWANQVGSWSASARNAVVDAIVDPSSGLGYNIFRYNIGGGEDPAHEHMQAWREMPGFQNASGTWDWNADANQRNVLRRIVERNPDAILEAFSNSPPYWMTKSGCASGNGDGSENLKDDSYPAFADYLTEVVKHYRDSYGIVFRTLEPLNEPNANWWRANGSQEGCRFGGANQQRILKAVGASLAAKGLTGTTVGASDENSLDEAYDIMRTYDAATLGYMSQMNGHSYNATAASRPNLRGLATARGKRLWQSESGPLGVSLPNNTEAALFMAGRIITDLRELQPEAWLDWQVADPSESWSSLGLDGAQQSWRPLKRFYMHAGFSRFIRPGATMLAVSGPDMVAFLAGDGATLAIVVRNGDTSGARSFTFDLTALPAVGTEARAHRTSRTEDLVSLSPIPIQGWSFTVSAPAFSLTTLVVPLR